MALELGLADYGHMPMKQLRLGASAITERASDRATALVLGLMSLVYLASTTYVGLNGNHVWRQADSLAQIYGFTGYKGMTPLQVFSGGRNLFDMPVYQFIVAAISKALDCDPIVAAHLFNLPCWGLFLLAGFMLMERLGGGGVWFVFLGAVSPLYLHYFSTPLPDVLALALALAAAAIIMRATATASLVAASASLVVAAFIKSPVPFVLVVFLLAHLLLSPNSPWRTKSWKRRFVEMAIWGAPASVAAVSAELIRKAVLGVSTQGAFAQDPSWYFGSVEQRLSPGFWQTMGERVVAGFPTVIIPVALVLVAVSMILVQPRAALRVIAPTVAAFFAGWLVFANVFQIHDYYELGVMTVVFLGAAPVLAWASDALKGLVSSKKVVATA